MPRRTKRKSKPKRRPRNASPEWFEIKQVLDERVEKGRTLYLIDWAGTDDKGNPWPPSWVCYLHQSIYGTQANNTLIARRSNSRRDREVGRAKEKQSPAPERVNEQETDIRGR